MLTLSPSTLVFPSSPLHTNSGDFKPPGTCSERSMKRGLSCSSTNISASMNPCIHSSGIAFRQSFSSSEWLRRKLKGRSLSLVGVNESIAVRRVRFLRPNRTRSYAVALSEESSQRYLAEKDSFSTYSGYIAESSTGEAELWDVYDAERIGKFYWDRPFLLSRRLLQISSTLGSWAAKRWLDNKLGKGEENFKERASELRAALVRLGPAFVKIAQAVSSRPDIVPPAYLQELSLLQDRIAPFATDAALDIIEGELGVPVEMLFSDISPMPVAAASLGQVYQARLRPNGQAVAVKVQRPGVRAAIALDVFILRILAGYARKFARLNTDLQAVVDEWASSLFREMDYQAEARNGIRFKKLFGSLPNVLVPDMYPELTSRRVLIMDWVEGERLSDVSDLALVEVGVYCSLSQLLDSGFYHADPHPGNLLRTPDGKLAYLDFGMMGEIKQDLREGLIEASVHLVNREFESLAGDFVTLGLLPKNSEMGAVADALTGVFQEAISKGVRNISFGDLSFKLGRTMYDFNFRLPAYFSLVVRSLTVLEGIALSSDPKYKVLGSSYPWIARKVLSDPSPQLRSTLRALLYKDGAFRFDRLESLLRESSRPMFNVDAAAQERDDIEDEGRGLAKRVLKFALSEQGEFVRDALLDELAKGIDAFNRAAVDAASEAVEKTLPFPVPLPGRLTEPEDWEHLDNLRRLSALLADTSDSSAAATPGGVMVGNGGLVTASAFGYAAESDGEEDEGEGVGMGGGGKGLTLDEVSVVLRGAGSLVRRLPDASVISELPLAAQRQAAMLPAELAGRLISRLLARTIRSTIARASSSNGQQIRVATMDEGL